MSFVLPSSRRPRPSFLAHLSSILFLTTVLSSLAFGAPKNNVRPSDPNSLPGFGPITALPGYRQPLPNGTQGGYLPLYKSKSQCVTAIYFILVPSANDPRTDPVVLWLQGGPGTSGLIGFFLENGPVTAVQSDGAFVRNEFSWHNNATYIVVDQPAPVGMSFVTDDKCLPESEEEAIQNLGDSLCAWNYFFRSTLSSYRPCHMMLRLANKIKLYCAFWGLRFFREISLLLRSYFPSLKDLPFFVFGESYGGKYVPELAVDIRERHSWINLQGVGVGDGWVDPPTQQMTYKEFAFQHGLINSPDTKDVERLEQECLEALNDIITPDDWRRANDVCSRIEEHIVNNSRANMYDVRVYGDYDNAVLTEYLRRPEVLTAMNVDSRAGPWSEDNSAIAYILGGWEQRPATHLYTQLLQNGTRTLLYNGMYDMDCNMIGTARWMRRQRVNMEWNLIDEFKATKRRPWSIKNKKVSKMLPSTEGANGKQPSEEKYVEEIVGGFVEVGSLTHVVINQAGHLVPMDVPHIAAHMLYSFTRGCSFADDVCQDPITAAALHKGIVQAQVPEFVDLVV